MRIEIKKLVPILVYDKCPLCAEERGPASVSVEVSEHVGRNTSAHGRRLSPVPLQMSVSRAMWCNECRHEWEVVVAPLVICSSPLPESADVSPSVVITSTGMPVVTCIAPLPESVSEFVRVSDMQTVFKDIRSDIKSAEDDVVYLDPTWGEAFESTLRALRLLVDTVEILAKKA